MGLILADDVKSIILRELESRGLVGSNRGYQLYTIEHKIAFMNVYTYIMGGYDLVELTHDTDKLVLYSMYSKNEASSLHRKHSMHHLPNSLVSSSNIVDTIIDFECARFTKEDKPLNAYNTIKSYYPQHYDILKPYLMELGLDSPENIEYNFDIRYKIDKKIAEEFIVSNISMIDSLMESIERNGVDNALIECFKF